MTARHKQAAIKLLAQQLERYNSTRGLANKAGKNSKTHPAARRLSNDKAGPAEPAAKQPASGQRQAPLAPSRSPESKDAQPPSASTPADTAPRSAPIPPPQAAPASASSASPSSTQQSASSSGRPAPLEPSTPGRPQGAPPGPPGQPSGPALTKPPAGTGSGSRSNRWLVSKAFPVDVRLLAAGVVGLGGALYYFTRPGEQMGYPSIGKEKPTRRELGLGPPLKHEPAPASPAAAADDAPDVGDRAHEKTSDPAESTEESGAFHNEEIALQPEPSQAAQGSADEQAHPQRNEEAALGDTVTQTIAEADKAAEQVDVRLMTDLLDDVGKTQWSADSETSAHPEVHDRQPAEDGNASVRPATLTDAEHAAAVEAKERAAAEVAALETLAEVQKLEGQKEEQVQKLRSSTAEAIQIVKESIGDSAAETLIASHSHGLRPPKSTEHGEPLVDEHIPLGIDDDISAPALVRQAIEQGARDWETYDSRLKQAEADSQLLLKLLRKAAIAHQDDLADAHQVAEGHAQRAQRITQVAQANAEQYKRSLAAQQALAESQREAELQRQAHFLTTAHAEAAVKERIIRSQALDEVRAQVNALGQAFHKRSNERLISTSAHRLASGTFALHEALARGQPYLQEVEALAMGCEDDPLVIVALQSVPEAYAERGLPTRAQLAARWPDVSRASRQLSFIPLGSGGILSVALSGLAARLKIREANTEQLGALSETLPDTIDAALAKAQRYMAEGQLQEAAHVLELSVAGTMAEGAIAEWTHAARARATAEQAIVLLQAHAASMSASLS